jgi:hypothetical protein
LDALLEKVAVPCGWGKAQEAALERDRVTKEQEQKVRHLQHLRDWPLQVDVKAIGDVGETFMFSYEVDGRPGGEYEVLLRGENKHIEAKHELRIITSDYQYAEIKMNGKQ